MVLTGDKKRAADNLRYAKRREKIITFLGGKCIICGSTVNLDIDHIDKANKSFSISKFYNYRWEFLLAELVKCQLLCKEHHKEKNKIDNGEAKHGSLTMYSHYRCRCDPCKSAWNDWHRERYASVA